MIADDGDGVFTCDDDRADIDEDDGDEEASVEGMIKCNGRDDERKEYRWDGGGVCCDVGGWQSDVGDESDDDDEVDDVDEKEDDDDDVTWDNVDDDADEGDLIRCDVEVGIPGGME